MTSSSVQNARDVQRTTLPNGLRVITETVGHVRSVSLGIWIGSGSRRESEQSNGISHFLEHMVFKGTAHRSAEEIAKVIDSTGGHLDAYTAKEMVSYNCKVIDDHLPLAFDVLADLVLNPMLREEDIEKEKGVILEELKMEVDNPEYLVHETFFGGFWKGHALGRSIIGTKKTISAFDRPAVDAYHKQVYVPANMVITAAGRLRHEEIVALAEKYFGGMASGEPEPVQSSPVPAAPVVLKNKSSLEQVHLCLGVPAYPIADDRRYVCYVLSTLLGGGMSSRLFQNIREKHGLCYSVFSELNLYKDTGCMAIYAGTSTENAMRLIGMVRDEVERLFREPLDEEDVRRAKDHLKGSLALSLESTGSRMSNLARQELFFGRFFGIDEMVAHIEAITAEQAQSLAREMFEGKQMAATVLGRVKDLPLTASDLVC